MWIWHILVSSAAVIDKVLLTTTVCVLLVILLLAPLIWLLIIVAVKIDLYSRLLRLYIVQHILNVIHYPRQIE